MVPNQCSGWRARLIRLASIALVAASFACSGVGRGAGGGDESEVRLEPVTVVELQLAAVGSVSELLVSNASVESELQADVVPRASGVVRQVLVGEGDSVQAGQVLATLDNVSLQEGATRASGNVRRLEVQLADARTMLSVGAGSERDVVELEGQLKDALSSGREARTGVSNTRLVAPFNGVIAIRDVKVGDLATSSKRAFMVVDLERLRVVASLPERDVGRVRVGQRATLIAAYDMTLKSTGVVSRISPVIDPSSGTFRVTITLDAEQRSLRPGQFVGVELQVDQHDQVVTVAKKAVVYEDGKPVIYRMIDRPPEDASDDTDAVDQEPKGGWFGISFDMGDGGTIGADDEQREPPSPYVSERVPVELGLIDNDTAEVTKGIRVGDKVIVIGQSNLKDGAPVKTAEMIEAQEAEEASVDDNAKAGSAG
ncbi:MAG: membrane fusion protein (multidrug efflux system) [Kiritimatiellia bacterium]|jgi:membrane fusion protein (multidrug efflux system)